MTDLSLNDPVHVSTREGRQLEGIIAYIGPVDFAEGEWIGVRLTQTAAGLGKNDGSVQGKEYFQCPPNCGMFVKLANITKRKLSKLEELKLKRELNKAVLASGSTTTTSTTPQKTASSSSKTPPKQTPSSSSKPIASSSSDATPSTKDKLAEIKKRREALAKLKKEREENTSAEQEAPSTEEHQPAIATSTTTTPTEVANPSTMSVEPPKQEAAPKEPSVSDKEWQAKLDAKDSENAKLQSELQDIKSELSKVQGELTEAENHVKAVRELRRQNESLQQKVDKLSQEASNAASSTNEEGVYLEKINAVERLKDELQDQLDSARSENADIKLKLEREQKQHQESRDELTKTRSQATALQQELQALADQKEKRTAADTSHYKERALMQGEISALKRKIETLEQDKINLDANIEDLTLDKEQLLEEKEELLDKLEELKLDAETAQMEAEELRVELEDAQASVDRITNTANEGGEGESEDKTQALAVQNARLREALIRLREQTSAEKMEISKQLRAAEKDAEAGRSLSAEVEELRAHKARMQDEINDLKDMVEQGSAFEQMVEDLSDRVLAIEEENIDLVTTIREMEEAAELTAEMEEVQAEEIKALSRDVEERDTLIRNLEEAIKMQKRRETDFQRTVSNYRRAVDTLKQEKQVLMDLQQGSAGEKSDAIASSQKALARAAQLVSDAAEMRKREAQAVVDKIDSRLYRNTSERLEKLVPKSVASSELSAIRGEMLASRVVDKASQSLLEIGSIISKGTPPPLSSKMEQGGLAELTMNDDVRKDARDLLHQGEFASVLVGVASDVLRLLAAGQWPELLDAERSTELGSLMGHTLSALDVSLESILKNLKEEGMLTVEQANLGGFSQGARTVIQALLGEVEREEGRIVDSNWNPPALKLLRQASDAKFQCTAVAASLGHAFNEIGFESLPGAYCDLYKRVEQLSSQANTVCQKFANLDILDDKLESQLSKLCEEWSASSSTLFAAMQNVLEDQGSLDTLQGPVESALSVVANISSVQRSASLVPNESCNSHALSPESDASWSRLIELIKKVNSVNGDADDYNMIRRASAIEQGLERAAEREPELDGALVKIESLEKNLASRLKEISMLNARLSELESLLAKSNSSARTVVKSDKSVEEVAKLKEENRVLTEAVDVLQRQADEYESEIRALKDFKSPRKPGDTKTTPRRAMTSINDLSSPSRASDETINAGILEATLFRPALQDALRESARWKGRVVGSVFEELAPLPALSVAKGPRSEALSRLNLAVNDYRLQRASTKLVRLGDKEVCPRTQLREQRAKHRALSQRLNEVVAQCRTAII